MDLEELLLGSLHRFRKVKKGSVQEVKGLLALSKQDNLLIAGCDGYLRPLSPLGAVDERADHAPNLTWSPDRQPLRPEDRLIR